GERARPEHGARDTRRGRPFEHGGMWLVALRIDIVVPLQSIQQGRPRAGLASGVAENAVAAGREAGAQACEAGCGGGGCAGGDRPPRQRVQERCLPRMRPEQPPAQTIDEQHAVAPTGWQAQTVMLTGNPERAEDGRQDVGQRLVAVARQDHAVRPGSHFALTVAADNARANRSRSSTRWAPSAVSLTRREKSSDETVPV